MNSDVVNDVVAFSRRGAREPDWPIHDAPALQEMLGTWLLGQRWGRRHLPAAVEAAGSPGPPLLLVQAGMVVAASQMLTCTDTRLTLAWNTQLDRESVALLAVMPTGVNVEVRRLNNPLHTATAHP